VKLSGDVNCGTVTPATARLPAAGGDDEAAIATTSTRRGATAEEVFGVGIELREVVGVDGVVVLEDIVFASPCRGARFGRANRRSSSSRARRRARRDGAHDGCA